MRTKKGGISSGTTTIINQGASNHVPGRPPANPLSYYVYIAPRQPGYQLVSSSSQGLQSNYANLIRRSHQYAVLINYANNMQTFQLITSICSPHQQITSVSVNPDKQVDIITVTCTQHINKYISRHPQIRVANSINRGPVALQYSSLSPHPKFQFSDWDPLDTCLYYYTLIMQTLHSLI